jgi:hypothetical protein
VSPQVVAYDSRTDDELDALAHERAFAHNLEFRVEQRGRDYCAAFKSYTARAALDDPDGIIRLASEASDRREAVIWLLCSDDLARELGLQLA